MTTKIISAKHLLTITRGDDIRVVTGDYQGEFGTVICAYQGQLTVGRLNGRAFVVPLADCEKEEAANRGGGLGSTQ